MSNPHISGLILAGGRGSRMGHVDKGLQPLRGKPMAAHVLERLAPQVAAVAINANQHLDAYAAFGVPVWPDETTGFAGPLAGLEAGLRHCATPFLLSAPCDVPSLPLDLAARLFAAMQAQGADLAIAVTLEGGNDGGKAGRGTSGKVGRPADAQAGVQLGAQPVAQSGAQPGAQSGVRSGSPTDGPTDGPSGEPSGGQAGEKRRQPHPVFCLVSVSVLPVLSAYLADGGRKMDGWYKGLKVAEVVFEHAGDFRNINTLDELSGLEHERPALLADVVSCLSDYDPDALPVRDAQRIIGQFVTPVGAIEQVALRSALGRVLARDIVSPINVPAHDNSAMDGYALRASDLAVSGVTTLRVIDTVLAGGPGARAPAPGECVRIMTGGVMPAACDSVVPQELVTHDGDDEITLAAGVIRVGDNRRFAGEDLAAGSSALRQGRVIRPADLGLLASLGIAEVPVRRRLRVAFFSTGDELRSIGEPLDAGCVYDSNRYTLFGMLTRLGCDIIDMGIVKDQPDALEAALRSACENADAIVTSGGVSVGAVDYTRQIMARLGDVMFWKIGMRPGRPLAFGKISSNGSSAFLFGLPGNPVAVMVSFYFFAREALLQMMGARAPLPLVRVRSAGAIRKKPGRTEYQRGVLAADGQTVRITGAQGSGILRSMSEANCMVVLHDEQGNVAEGDLVDVLLFDGLI